MRRLRTGMVLLVGVTAALVGVSPAAAAPPEDTFGHHVSQCATAGALNGDCNPGMHRGNAGHHHHDEC